MLSNLPFNEDGKSLSAEEALRKLSLMEEVKLNQSNHPDYPQTDENKVVGSNTEIANKLSHVNDEMIDNNGSVTKKLTDDIQNIVLSILKLDSADFSATTPLMDYGLDSIAATEIGNLFTSRFDIVIPPTVFFEFPDLESFVNYLLENHPEELKAHYPQNDEVQAAIPNKVVQQETQSPPLELQATTISKSSDVNPAETTSRLPIEKVNSSSHDQLIADHMMDIETLWKLSSGRVAERTINNIQPVEFISSENSNHDQPIKQPSREYLQEMKYFTDLANIHSITRHNKRALEYATFGEGPPLLMLGGLLMHYSVMWLTNIKALAKNHQLIMFHMPGCGELELYEEMSLQSISDDISGVLDAQGIQEPIPVFGCSFGGVLAQAFTLAYPEKCSALAVAVSTPFAEGATDFQLLMKELQVSPHFMELNRGWPMASLPVYEKVIAGFDFRSKLRSLNIPALVVSGGKDRYTTPEYSQMMADSLQNAKLIEFPDAGHLLTFSHHEEFNQVLIDFLTSVQKPRPTRSKSIRNDHSVFLPATKKTLNVMKDYVTTGQQGHCVMLSDHAAQLALSLNAICNKHKDSKQTYRSYFTTSVEEGLDAALRLARHYARNTNSKSQGQVLLIGAGETWKNHFDPMHSGTNEALVPGIHFVANIKQATNLVSEKEFCAVVIINNGSFEINEVEQFIRIIDASSSLSVLLENNEHKTQPRDWFSYQLSKHLDLIVHGECLSGFQAPVSSLSVNDSIKNPWLMTPSEGYVRQPMASFGLTLNIAFDYISDYFIREFTPDQLQKINNVKASQDATYQAHLEVGNIGYAKVANMHGFDSRFYEAYGLQTRVNRHGQSSRAVIDCLSNVGSAPRGLNPQDVIENVLNNHNASQDYWQDLTQLIKSKTGFSHCLPASSQTTAIETALSVAKLASPKRKKIVCFTGGAGFTMLSANSAKDGIFDLFRKPFEPLYPHTLFIDPLDDNATDILEKALLSNELAFVWVETIQVEGNAVRSLPEKLITLVNQHKQRGGYLIAVDETQTNVGTGQFLHSHDRITSPDIVAIATALTDSFFPVGAVLTTDAIADAIKQENATYFKTITSRSANQLSAHIALNSLEQIDQQQLMPRAVEIGKYLKSSLQTLSHDYPLLCDVRGEGLVLGVEFDLSGYDAFIQQSFGYFLWGAMMRDQMQGVVVVVCPVHNRSLRIMPPLTITKEEVDLVVENLRRRLEEGVEKIILNCAEYADDRNDPRTADFLRSAVANDKKIKVQHV